MTELIETPVDPKPAKNRRRRKARKASTATAAPLNDASEPATLKDDSFTNKKITDYFQIRKSTRRCKSDLEKEKMSAIEEAVRTKRENGLEVRLMEAKGRGVFATRAFAKGDFIVEYAGDLISLREAKKRETNYAKDAAIGCYMYFFEFKGKSYCIDATAESGRLGRLLNHSKTENNCHTKLFDVESRPILAILASRDIELDEELLYDYGDRSSDALKAHPWLKK